MLDVKTRQRIDTARDILVGKVPDPKSQVDQITLALMYKFMDDIDAEAEEYGGNATFFVGDFARYSWRKIIGRGIGAHEATDLYDVGIRRMGENPGLPPLFRSIFNNAYLPYRDPETLRAFLQVIDEFEYDNSERLGDAFEYLLSIMGSQGDAGQFRTPRHIIDFMVEVVDPKKDDIILDPACGTAGFLISAYKHIAKTNHDAETPLTPAERGRLAGNVSGYDISPDMVRLSLVNLYLHRFPDPDIFEYDTLTSEDRWNEYSNVILANPPFMSPKGGIRPHNRFSVKSKRSEVLFVDYIAEHLTPDGRAGVIVPEGIIFQSQNAHKQLRKMLVEDYLVAVVSLPPGVFNPYSGVKTSVFVLDKSLARRSDTIGFFKVENDGFDLGAQRRPIDRDDLPRVKAEVAEYLGRLRADDGVEDFAPEHGLVVEKERIGEDGEFNLSGERYRDSVSTVSKYPYVQVRDILDRCRKSVMPSSLRGKVTYIGLENIEAHAGRLLGDLIAEDPATIKSTKNIFGPRDILYGKLRPNLNKVWLADREGICSSDIFVIQPINDDVLPEFYEHVLRSEQFNDEAVKRLSGAQLPRINWQSLAAIEVPLPPLEVQREIVSEIEGYQRVIEGARAVVENWRPRIAVDPEWPVVELGKVCETIRNGYNVKQTDDVGKHRVTRIQTIADGTVDLSKTKWTNDDVPCDRFMQSGDILFSHINSVSHLAKTAIFDGSYDTVVHGINLLCLRPRTSLIDPWFLLYSLKNERFVEHARGFAQRAVNQASIKLRDLRKMKIAIAPTEEQIAIVDQIRAEKELVDGNQRLIERMEEKVRDVVRRVWTNA